MENFDGFRVKAHETFAILRELSAPRTYMFRWYQFRDAWRSVNGWPFMSDQGASMTLGNLLRGWYAAGLIKRLGKGLYRFSGEGIMLKYKELGRYRMYCAPGSLTSKRRLVDVIER